MADERDAWLDKDAAERLLRGDPVEDPDAYARARRERLSGALRDMSAVTYANDEELPGEAAALAAFRQAGEAEGGTDLLGTVRLALAPGTVRARRRGRPLRRGLVVAVAGCALGGLTVAAGATVLPSFFGGPGHGPAGSVSAGVSPRPLSSDSADRGHDRPAPPSDRPSADGAGERAPASPSATPSAPGSTADAARGEAEGDEDTPAGSADGRSEGFVPNTDPASGAWYRETVDACRDYRSGAIDSERRKALDSAADEPGGTKRYCDRLLDGDLRGGGGKDRNGGGKDRNGFGGHGGQGGQGDQGGQGEEGGHGEEGGQGESGQPQLTPAPPTLPTTAPPPYGTPVPETSRRPTDAATDTVTDPADPVASEAAPSDRPDPS
ncbi:hypothetical protein ACIOHE_31665 [Streptomyces sp. NPDC087851]|uniref:hypothetical protein n=1 Tax=Streptomyces sp. NPDC087851 TaxID=3365810 RepID=UPI00381FCF3A